MADTDLLEKVKQMIGLTGTHQDDHIQCYIDDIKQYLLDGGVKQEIVESPSSVGAIARGVSDLYFDGQLSNYFKERAIQLAIKGVGMNVQTKDTV